MRRREWRRFLPSWDWTASCYLIARSPARSPNPVLKDPPPEVVSPGLIPLALAAGPRLKSRRFPPDEFHQTPSPNPPYVTNGTGSRILGALFVLATDECRKAPSAVWMSCTRPARQPMFPVGALSLRSATLSSGRSLRNSACPATDLRRRGENPTYGGFIP